MKFQLLVIVATLAWTGLCAVNEPCIGEGGKPGVCIEASKCTSSGGKSISNACPKDAKDVKCCTKPTCGTGDNKGKGNCSWQSDCAGSSISNQCPGPAQMKCCLSSGNGFGGYSSPKIPPVGACKRVAVDGAGKIVKQFPGRVRQVFCTRDCKPGDRPSDHCTGKATDMMCSDGGGIPTMSGREIAEWVMKNHETLNVKYVIWGQRIWESTEKEKGWTSWKPMEDRKSITQNHWDHVHVSYK